MKQTDSDAEVAWADDKLNRQAEGEWLEKYLTSKYISDGAENSRNFVLNINADWGFGKTYFVKNLELILRKNHPVVFFDAWKNDFSDKPLLGFISEINDSLNDYLDKDTSSKIKSTFKHLVKASTPLLAGFLAKQLAGLSYDKMHEIFENEPNDDESAEEIEDKSELNSEISKKIKSLATSATKKALTHNRNTKQSIDYFKKSLKYLVASIEEETNKKAPLFIIIDELDRCRPTYAIELLETIKHLFEVDGVYFILATATEQLSHSINAVYGNEFESKRYLNRFFHQEYTLSTPSVFEYTKYLWGNFFLRETNYLGLVTSEVFDEKLKDEDVHVVIVSKLATYLRVSLRELEQAIKILKSIDLTYEKGLFTIVIAFLVLCKIRHPNLYNKIRNSWPKLDYRNGSDLAQYIKGDFNGSLIFKVKYFANQQIQNKQYSLFEFLESILELEGRDFDDIHHHSVHDRCLYECLNSLRNDYKFNSLDGSGYTFLDYFDLIDRAGKLS